ncbi:preprotein translocase subunit YajC [Microbacteriaceae bacterium 4G12]
MINLIWILVVIIFLLVFVAIPIKQQKKMKKDHEFHREFLDKLLVGDKVLLSSGMYGVVRNKETNAYHIEIAQNVLVEVAPQFIVGKDTRKNNWRYLK